MASSTLILPSGANLVAAEQVRECRAPPTEGAWRVVANATTTPNEKEAEEERAQHEAPENGEENQCNRKLPEDLLELLELQKRMFQSP